ncbi:MAG: hypothetical protein IJK87_15630, partial [Prevotella sp.]|nr:hypothetical protein [Prevotella sp.]
MEDIIRKESLVLFSQPPFPFYLKPQTYCFASPNDTFASYKPILSLAEMNENGKTPHCHIATL